MKDNNFNSRYVEKQRKRQNIKDMMDLLEQKPKRSFIEEILYKNRMKKFEIIDEVKVYG